MKFLCPSCKAKYQIADEKVAGRSVRMKCRKCGQEIRVSSADAIASSTAPPPPDEEAVVETGSQVSLPNVVEKPAPAPVAIRAPAKPAAGTTPSPAPVVARPRAPSTGTNTSATATPHPLGKAARSAATAAEAGQLPRSAAVTATPNPVGPLARSAAAGIEAGPSGKKEETLAARPPPRPFGAGKAGALSRPLNRASTASTDKAGEAVAEKSQDKAGAANAGPASEKVPDAKTAETNRVKPAAVERPAARPAAPSVLAAKRPQPKPEPRPEPVPSMVREDEFAEEEQTQIAEFGALAGAFKAVVVAAQQPAHQISDPLTMPGGDEWFVGINGVPVGPIRLSELRSKASTGSVTKESLVWRDGFEEWRPLKSFPELAAIVEEGLSSALAAGAPLTRLPIPGAGDAISDPFGATVPQPGVSTPAAVTGAAVVTDDLDIAGLRTSRRTGNAAWIAVVVALFFGISVGFVIFSRKPAEIVRYVEVPAKGAEPTAQAPAAQNDSVIPETQVPGKEVKTNGKTSGTSKPPPGTPKPGEPGGLPGLRGLPPPMTGGPGRPGTETPGAGGSQLESSQVQQVVARYTPSVKRSCWQPALDTRDKDASTSARVVVSIQVSASGSVQSASTTSDPKGYRGLATCIVGRVRGWQFPAASGATTVNVPFVFVAQ